MSRVTPLQQHNSFKATETVQISDYQSRMLLTILARVAAIFWPFRVTKHPDAAYAETMIRRDKYLHGTGLYQLFGGSNKQRTRAHRALRTLVDEGLVHVIRPGHLRLPVDHLDYVLALTPNPLLSDAWDVFETLAELEQCRGALLNAKFVHESQVIGRDVYQSIDPDLSKFYEAMLPFLIAGYVETASDTKGAVGIRVTPSGQRALTRGRPKRPADLPGYSPELFEHYLAEHTHELTARESWQQQDRNHIFLPLSAARWEPYETAPRHGLQH